MGSLCQHLFKLSVFNKLNHFHFQPCIGCQNPESLIEPLHRNLHTSARREEGGGGGGKGEGAYLYGVILIFTYLALIFSKSGSDPFLGGGGGRLAAPLAES